mgnify:CR=1 FL=1|tara:strand:+ start:3920 stop:4918 length:999 start_codon:yes stop_codon:yes gene_type:complete
MAFSNNYDQTNPGSGVSNREELTDILTILAPEDTPVLSSATKTKGTSSFPEWTVDTLSSPVTTGIAEGADVTAFTDKFAARARLGNRVQKFRRDYMVSDIQEAVDSVGPAKYAQAETKAMMEIKRDIEATLLSANDRSTEDGAGTVNGLRGLGDWIDSSGPSDVPADYRTPAASIHSSGAFTETIFNNIITSIFRVNGSTNGLTLVADTALRRVISDFARLDPIASTAASNSIRTVNYNGDSAKIKLSVELYHSDHGIVSIVNMNPDTSPNTTDKDVGYLLNPEYYGVSELIPLSTNSLPNLGGGERGYCDATLSLIVNHPGAHGKITDVTA